MIVRALIVAAALGAGATYVVLDGHDCDGHDEARAACECKHDMTLLDCASVEAGCCCAGGPLDAAAPTAELLRPKDVPAAALPTTFHTTLAWPPVEPDFKRFGTARAPPATSLLAQRTSFLC